MKNRVIRSIGKKSFHLLTVEIVMSIIMNVSVILGTGMIAGLIDEFIQKGHIQFDDVLLPTFVCMLVGTITAYYKKYFAGLYSIQVTKRLNDYAIAKLTRIKYLFFEKEGSGKIITKLISDIGELERYYESTLPDLVNNIISIVLVMVYVGGQNILLLLVSLCLYPIVLVITYFLGKRLKTLANKRRGKIDVMVERVTESIEGIEVIRSYNLYHRFVSHIHEAIEDILENEYVRAWITHFSQTVNRLLFWIPNMVCPCFAMYMVIDGRMSIGAMTAYIVLIHKIMGEIKMMPFLLNEFRERQISMERVEKVLEEPEENMGQDLACRDESQEQAERIEFRKVSFAYNADGEPVLNKMSFEIPEGKTIAFVGESGQGKSTIFKLLCGFYEKGGGSILINGRSVDETGLTAVRDKIAMVEQHPFVFEGTILENIAAGGINASKQQIMEAARLAGIHDFIIKLPKQYHTMIGENGAGLSGGEKQRIAIARALLKDAPILLMDEPTASVDISTESIIQETIRKLKGKKTILIIAHRLSTIHDVDCIMVVNNGGICECGTHRELMNNGGIYRNLYEYEQKGGVVNG